LKLVQERAGTILEEIDISNDLLSRTQSGSAIKRNNQQMGVHEIKIFCITKEMVSKLKWSSTEWKKNLS
jgi:hypothetical protein